MAESGPLEEVQQASIDLLRGALAFATNRGGDAPLLLLTAAKRFETIDADVARQTYLDAISAAAFAGRLATPGGGVLEVARAAAEAPAPSQPGTRARPSTGRPCQRTSSTGYAAAVPKLREALVAFGNRHVRRRGTALDVAHQLGGAALVGRRALGSAVRRYLQLARTPAR